MRLVILLYLLNTFVSSAQKPAIVLGNHDAVFLPDNGQFNRLESLPENLDSVSCILLFSNAASILSQSDADRLIRFLQGGGGLYLGADNWPLQSEANQLAMMIYGKEYYGEFDAQKTQSNIQSGHLHFDSLAIIPAGLSTSAFPLDHRLAVEIWNDDQPLVLTGFVSSGRIILDGGYSRFYLDNRSPESDAIMREFLRFLCGY